MELYKGLNVGISYSGHGEIDIHCMVQEIKDRIANIYVWNGDWYGLLNLDTMDMEVQVPLFLRKKNVAYIKNNYEPDREPEYDPNPIIHCEIIPYWTYKDGRCTLCGAKEEEHAEHHLCRMHRPIDQYMEVECLVCGKAEEVDDSFYDDDIPF